MNPHTTMLQSISSEILAEKKKIFREMTKAALPHLHKLFKLFGNEKAFILLVDADSVVLEYLYAENGSVATYVPDAGDLFSEDSAGTNAIALSLMTDSLSYVQGCEHWLEKYYDIMSVAAPLHVNDGVVGTIALVWLKSAEQNLSLALSLVESTVYGIERESMIQNLLSAQTLVVTQQRMVLDFVDTGLIAISKNGEIRQINQQALTIFHEKGIWEGRGIAELVNSPGNFFDLLCNTPVLEEHDVPVHIGDIYIHVAFSTFIMKANQVDIWMIIRCREFRTVKKLMNKVSHNVAYYSFEDIISEADTMKEPLKLAKLASKATSNVLVTGETGTGKELLVQSIHNGGSRRGKPFVAINCGVVSRELIRSELFGYEGGAFTGAKSTGSMGKFELADGGTLFLDEIGEMPADVQAVLLRVLQTHQVTRVGGKYPIPVDVRVIAATNRDLEQDVRDNFFRGDLYYRLNVLSIILPPLRERGKDIQLLADFFVEKYVEEKDGISIKISPEVYDVFDGYPWPGNIRELENVIHRAILLSEDGIVRRHHLPTNLQAWWNGNKEQKLIYCQADLPKIDDMKAVLVRNALKDFSGNVKKVASYLNLSRGTVYNMMKKYGFDGDTYRDMTRK
ncbi:sigma54 specific transcriptional regulator, Fis family [Parasphaerochaeta coccoides DSM 17374]|uniref:Sigma54 specific transcriptional regulator, Fis family n=2 Tax=Parasphaerochaeta TaxID=3062336 RepID=F4GI96_PARC1|nr:sigma54 specific transcriptional regulator, Fis family [Parasphaerochaeta coccoides DSM 17374]